jgi:RNA 3'-terminal phosphate cyclase (ATP)
MRRRSSLAVRHLADQLLVPIARAGGGAFRTGPLSHHTTTNIAVIEQFLTGGIQTIMESNRACRIELSARSHRQ